MLVLRDVLCCSAAETAQVLDTTVAAVNSALQRARATLREVEVAPGDPRRPDDPAQQRLLDRYCDAFVRYDVETLVSLLREDATMTMPPFVWWLHGRADIRTALLAAGRPCDGARLVVSAANGLPAFWQFRPDGPGGAMVPFALVVLEVAGDRITGVTNFLDAEHLWPLFDSAPPHRDEFAPAASYH